MADIFDVLADATRREILSRLLDSLRAGSPGEVSVGQLVAQLEISQPTVSKHLKVLREQGLVRVRDEGQHRYYSLDAAPLDALEDWLAPFLVGGPVAAADDASAGSTVYAAWAGADTGDRIGRAAADTAHSARVAIEAAQEKLQGAQKRVTDKLPRWNR